MTDWPLRGSRILRSHLPMRLTAVGSPNYTIDTLLRLQKQFPSATLYTLIGADSFLAFLTGIAARRYRLLRP